MKKLRQVFTLTVPEQRVVIFIVGVLLAFAAAKIYRDNLATHPGLTSQPSPSPGILP